MKARRTKRRTRRESSIDNTMAALLSLKVEIEGDVVTAEGVTVMAALVTIMAVLPKIPRK